MLANLNYNDENYTYAKDLFKEFITAYSGSEILISSAYAGVAACEEKEDKLFEAAEDYYKAYSVAEELPQAGEYLYLAGLNYLNANDQAKAKEMFEKLIDEFPNSPKKYDAQVKLILASAQ